TRLAILWIKEVWHHWPGYRNGVTSLDIYDAVLQHGIRTPAEFMQHIVAEGKPAGSGVQHRSLALQRGERGGEHWPKSDGVQRPAPRGVAGKEAGHGRSKRRRGRADS